jgi:hypothetical protein
MKEIIVACVDAFESTMKLVIGDEEKVGVELIMREE